MKKRKSFFGIFLALLLCVTTCPISAFAVSSQTDKENQVVDTEEARIIVPSGVMAFVREMRLYPAQYDGSKTNYSDTVYKTIKYSNSANTTTVIENVPSTETKNLLQRFESVAGEPANAWFVKVHYYIQTDGKGSYGRYFEYREEGDSVEIADNAKRKFTVPAYQSNSTFALDQTFLIPEGSNTNKYGIGLWGGFYFHNGQNNMNLNHMSGFKFMLNSDL